ncbi:MAG: methionyl-tRNA formyltransferase, partial [Bacteroidota bacterium]
FVRGLSPVPCAWTTHRGTTLKIYRTSIRDIETQASEGTAAGEVVLVEKEQLLVKTGDGVLAILEIQQEGRKRMKIADFLRGYELRVGDSFQ